MADENITTKVCKICKENKSLDLYHKTPSNKDGRFGSCKACEQSKQHARYIANREEIRKKASDKLKSDPEKLKKKIEALNKWEEDNPDKVKASNKIRRKKYYEDNIEGLRNKNKEWHRSNKDRVKAYKKENEHIIKAQSANRQAKIYSSEGIISGEEIKSLHLKQEMKCKICSDNIKDNYHIDHITPFSRGGLNNISNIQLTCPTCNLKKGTKTLNELIRLKTHKYCSGCNKEFKLKNFSKNKNKCKKCEAFRIKKWRLSNKEKDRLINLKYRERNRERLRLEAIEYRKTK